MVSRAQTHNFPERRADEVCASWGGFRDSQNGKPENLKFKTSDDRRKVPATAQDLQLENRLNAFVDDGGLGAQSSEAPKLVNLSHAEAPGESGKW